MTGRELIPGENISPDHILPRAKFPELADDIDNIHLVDYYVNRAKSDLLVEDFVEMCREVVEYHG